MASSPTTPTAAPMTPVMRLRTNPVGSLMWRSVCGSDCLPVLEVPVRAGGTALSLVDGGPPCSYHHRTGSTPAPHGPPAPQGSPIRLLDPRRASGFTKQRLCRRTPRLPAIHMHRDC